MKEKNKNKGNITENIIEGSIKDNKSIKLKSGITLSKQMHSTPHKIINIRNNKNRNKLT